MREHAKYSYGPFGEVVRASGPMAGVNPFEYSTKYTDQETGINYYGYRYYNPSTGRWLSRDPIGDIAFCEQNLQNVDSDRLDQLASDANDPEYLFVKNSPLNNVDWLGLNTTIQVRMSQDGPSHNNTTVEGRTTDGCCNISFQQQVSTDGSGFELDGPGEQRYGNKKPPYQSVVPKGKGGGPWASTGDRSGFPGLFTDTQLFFSLHTRRMDFISILYCDDTGKELGRVKYGYAFTKGKYSNYGTGTFNFP